MKSGSAEFLVGQVVAAAPQGGGPKGRGSVYALRDDQGRDFTCDYLELVTVGFRTLTVGDRVRFEPVYESSGAQRARHVLKLDQPSVERLYGPSCDPLGPQTRSPAEGMKMRHLEVRERQVGDLAQLSEALVAVHDLDGYPVEGVGSPLLWLDPPGTVKAWSVVVDGDAVGQAMLVQSSPEERRIGQQGGAGSQLSTLCRVFVHPDTRGLGAGRLLVQAAQQFAQSEGFDLVLDVMNKDSAAIALYEAMGWIRIHESVHHFGEGQQIPCFWYIYRSSSELQGS